jgi:hypothetical protein
MSARPASGRTRRAATLLLAGLALAGCGRGKDSPPAAAALQAPARNAVQFTDVTHAAGLAFVHNSGAFGRKYLPETMGSGVVFLDYDGDGLEDLFFVQGADWPERRRHRTTQTLYRNKGDGTFEDVSKRAGIYDPTGKSLGVVALDYDGDGWPDLAVANDTQPNFLYHNKRDGTFEEVGKTAGIAFSEEGKARGAMGIDAADYDGSGRDSLVIGNFSNEMLALYHNEGRGLFIDDAAMSGVGQPSLLTLAFGCFFFDFDLDGALDIFVANGHVENDINRVQPSVTYAQPPHLFRGLGGGRFEQIEGQSGTDLQRPLVARGAAYADFDNDGDLDIVVSTNNGPPVLLRNDGGNADGWLRLRLVGRGRSNRDAVGAVVRLKAGSVTGTRTVRSAASYASQSEFVLTFGLGPARDGRAPAADLRITWPDGATQTVTGVEAGRLHVLEESSGAN